jgi:hypothetical protein
MEDGLRRRESGIERRGAFQRLQGVPEGLGRGPGVERPPEQEEAVGLGIGRRRRRRWRVPGEQDGRQLADHRPRDLVLDGEDVGELPLVGLAPHPLARRCLHHLGLYPQSSPRPPDASFEEVGHAELPGDLRRIRVLSLEPEAGRAGGDPEPGDAGEDAEDLHGDAVGEVVLILPGAQVGEGDHGDREAHRQRRDDRREHPFRKVQAVHEGLGRHRPLGS